MALKKFAAILGAGGVELKTALVDGAAADTDIAVSGLSWKRGAEVYGAFQLEGTATYAAPAALTDELVKGTDDNEIQFGTTNTSGDKVLLLWAQRAK